MILLCSIVFFTRYLKQSEMSLLLRKLTSYEQTADDQQKNVFRHALRRWKSESRGGERRSPCLSQGVPGLARSSGSRKESRVSKGVPGSQVSGVGFGGNKQKSRRWQMIILSSASTDSSHVCHFIFEQCSVFFALSAHAAQVAYHVSQIGSLFVHSF